MKATIVNFRRSRHRTTANHMILMVEGVDSKEKAKALVGKSVKWLSPAKKEMIGKVASSHGNKGAVRAIFDAGMPGQAIGTEASIE